MNINRLKFGFIIGLVGIVGATTFGVVSMPYAIETVNKASEGAEKIVINETIDLSKYGYIENLNINSMNPTVSISKSDKGYSYIEYTTNEKEKAKFDITYNKDNKSMNIGIETDYAFDGNEYKKGMSMKSFIDTTLLNRFEDRMRSHNHVSIYLANPTDLKITNSNGNIFINDSDILKDNLSIDSGFNNNFSLPSGHKLKKVDIKSQQSLHLYSGDFKNVEELNIESDAFTFIQNLTDNKEINDGKILNNLNISANEVNLNFKDSLAKNIKINNANSIYIYGNSPSKPIKITSKNIQNYTYYENYIHDELNYKEYNQIALDKKIIGDKDEKIISNIVINNDIERLSIEPYTNINEG